MDSGLAIEDVQETRRLTTRHTLGQIARPLLQDHNHALPWNGMLGHATSEQSLQVGSAVKVSQMQAIKGRAMLCR